jgi:hypothetical protein
MPYRAAEYLAESLHAGRRMVKQVERGKDLADGAVTAGTKLVAADTA